MEVGSSWTPTISVFGPAACGLGAWVNEGVLEGPHASTSTPRTSGAASCARARLQPKIHGLFMVCSLLRSCPLPPCGGGLGRGGNHLLVKQREIDAVAHVQIASIDLSLFDE